MENEITKVKAPRNKLGHLVLNVGVSNVVFTPKIRVLTTEEIASIEKRTNRTKVVKL